MKNLLTLILGVLFLASMNNQSVMAQTTTEFSPLPYAFNALEPYIDQMTMEIHYDKHHRAYFNNFTKAIEGSELRSMTFEQIFANIGKQSMTVRNNGGGHYNHVMFWSVMSPTGGGVPPKKLSDAIHLAFGSFEKFREVFEDAARTRFGSGWAWLNVDKNGKLFVSSTPNQDNPLMDVAEKQGIPLLCLDVWEHAYYLKYQNRRADYISNFWKIVNWEEVSRRYENAMK